MRGDDQQQSEMFSYVSLEERVPQDHPLRRIREMVDQILRAMAKDFDAVVVHTSVPSFKSDVKTIEALKAVNPNLKAGLIGAKVAVQPERVARAMLRGIERHARVVNVVPSHALGAMLGEWFPRLTDAAIARFVAVPERPRASKPLETPEMPPLPESSFDRALSPVTRRMERVKLPVAFVRGLVNDPGTRVELGDAAMRWAGMPNKNERAALREVLETLAGAGYLESTGDETWIVRRAAD